jgi:hypothetical protein
MSQADWFVLAGSILGYLLMLGLHETRAIRREDRAVERHNKSMAPLEDLRRLTLAAIDQRNRLEARVVKLESRMTKVEDANAVDRAFHAG